MTARTYTLKLTPGQIEDIRRELGQSITSVTLTVRTDADGKTALSDEQLDQASGGSQAGAMWIHSDS